MGTIAEKLTYLNDTRLKIKDGLNKFGADLTENDTFRSYSNVLNDIYDKLPKVSGNGSNFTLENAQKGKLDLFEMEGNTHQDSYSGKNLFNSFAISKNEVQIQDDGEILISGITTVNGYCHTQKTLSQLSPNLQVGDVVYLYLTTDFYENGNLKDYIYIGGNWRNGATKTITQAMLDANVIIYGGYQTTSHLKIMITKELDTNYEPFVGGSPSPSPDYPQQIKVVENKQVVNVHGKNLFDGEYEVGGYDASTGEKVVNAYQYRNKNFIEVKPNTTYTFSLNEIKITETPRYYYYDKNKNFLSSEVVNGNFTTPNNCYFVNWNSSALKTNYPDGLENVQIEENSTATPFEKYHNQDYEIDLHGKNLFDINAVTSVLNGTLDSDGVITSTSGTTVNFNVAPIFPQQTLYSGKTYYLSADIRRVSGEGTFGKINDFVGDWQMVIAPTLTNEFQRYVYKLTFTVDRNYYRILFQFRNTNNGVFEIKNIMLSESNEDYEPYYNYELCEIGDYKDSIKKSTGKNLFDKNNVNTLNAYISLGNNKITSSNADKCLYMPIKNNTTYTISKILSSRFVIGCVDEEPVLNSSVCNPISGNQASNTTYTITSGNNSKYLVIFYYTTSDTLIEQQILDSIQIEEGSTVTDYEPYGTDWYIKKNIGKVVLDGSEAWVLAQTNTDTLRFNCANGLINGLDINTLKIISNNFVNGISTSDNSDNEHIRSAVLGYPAMVSICINKTRLSSQNVEGFKTWLSNNPVTVYYVLATPTNTEITDTTLIEQLEALETETGTNIFEVSNDNDVLPSLNVKRLKELEKLS